MSNGDLNEKSCPVTKVVKGEKVKLDGWLVK